MLHPGATKVSLTAVWFLVAIAVVTILIVIFYMYVTRKACFQSCKGCESFCEPDSLDESDSESSSDIEEKVYSHMQNTVRRSKAVPVLTPIDQQSPAFSVGHSSSSSISKLIEHEELNVDLHTMKKDNLSTWDEIPESQSFNTSIIAMTETASDVGQEHPYSLLEEDDQPNVGGHLSSFSRNIDDVSDENLPISVCGTVDLALRYMLSEKEMKITIIQAQDLPTKDRGGSTIIQVRIVVLPAKRKRYKTKVQHVASPHFDETFKLSCISPEDLRGLGLRVRLYGIGKVRDRLIGEATVRFDELNLISDPLLTVTLQLEPRTNVNLGDTELTSQSMEGPSIKTLAYGGSEPQILLSLSYDKMTGKLAVKVVKGSHFLDLTVGEPPDTYVKVVLLNSTFQEMKEEKTQHKKGPNPVFQGTFYFQVALFQLAEVSLMISVYRNDAIKRKSMLGWISLGLSSSDESCKNHWQEMQEANGEIVSRWHTVAIVSSMLKDG